jgi:hypothetical protein
MEEMDGAHFQKLCRDCGLLSRPAINTTVVDITFTKVSSVLIPETDMPECAKG